jgi:hypothetical protein
VRRAQAALIGLAMVGCLVAAGCAGSGLAAARPAASPPAAATFIAAHVAGAAALAEPGRSPLHRAELARRGRASELPDPLWAVAAPALDFEPAGALEDGYGFAHALYIARPRRSPTTGPASVWRVDLDPLGRVIWGEPVRLLGSPAASVVRAADRVGVRSAAGDGYVGVVVRCPGRPDLVAFAILDEDGTVGPDRWSFDQPLPLGDPDDHHALAPPFGPGLEEVPSADRPLLRAYLAALPAGLADRGTAGRSSSRRPAPDQDGACMPR